MAIQITRQLQPSHKTQGYGCMPAEANGGGGANEPSFVGRPRKLGQLRRAAFAKAKGFDRQAFGLPAEALAKAGGGGGGLITFQQAVIIGFIL